MPIAKIGRVDDWFTPNAATLFQILETERDKERDREIDRERERIGTIQMMIHLIHESHEERKKRNQAQRWEKADLSPAGK